MPRIVLVHQPIDGGVGRHVSDLAAGLAERAFDVTLCGPGLPGAEVADASMTHVDLELRREVDPGSDLRATSRLARIVREVRPDLIHAHSSKAGVIARLQRIANPTVPVLYTPHLYSFASSFARGPKRLAYREVERVLAPLATRVLCVCEAEAALAASIGSAGKVRVVHNGIRGACTQDSPDQRMAELARSGPVICAVALLHHRKGLDTLVAAAPAILASHPDAQLAIWGDGPELSALQALAGQLGVAHAVHFLGRCADPIAALRCATVFVHPARAEAFPYVILEAMSVGLPIVATDVGGVGEAVLDGQTGVLVPPGESEALSHALIGMLEHPDRRSRMGAQGYDRFERCFTLSAMLDGVTGVYGEVAPACRPTSFSCAEA